MKLLKIKIIEKILYWYCFLVKRNRDFLRFNETPPKTIVIYSTTALGDYLMNTPAIWHLRNKFPTSKMILVTSKKNHDLVEKYDWYDQIYTWDNKVVRVLPLLFKLRKNRPELSIILHAGFPYDILCSVLSGSDVIFRDHYGSESPLLNKYLDNYSRYYDGHTIKRKLKLIESFEADIDNVKMYVPKFENNKADKTQLLRVGFQLGASNGSRRWPVENFSELACMLFEKLDDLEITITGTPSELKLAQSFLEQLPASYQNKVVIMAGKTSIIELVSLVRNLDILVTGDTGPLHIAIAAGVKTVSLFVTANPFYTGPCQDQDKHIILHCPVCTDLQTPMKSIQVSNVFDAVMKTIGKSDGY